MSKNTIFGEENFMPTNVVQLYQTQVEEKIVNGMLSYSKRFGLEIDEQKLKRWLIMCNRLENIDEDETLSFAIRKKFDEKDHEIEVLKKAFDNVYETMFRFSEELGYEGVPNKNFYLTSYERNLVKQAEKEINGGKTND